MSFGTRISGTGPEFQDQMKQYIRDHFADLLGEHILLLEQEGGLDTLSELMRAKKIGA